jgi:alginate O-acetyltransferase complex protein AlgJ
VKRLTIVVLALALMGAAARTSNWRGVFAQLAATAGDDASGVLRGRNGWLFLGSELRHLSLERFWGDQAAAVSRSRRAEWADPRAAILDVKQQLDARGIELLFVPVPAKAAVHAGELPLDAAAPGGRADAPDAAFYADLEAKGVSVLDLEPELARLQEPAFCRQDTHWCPPGIERAASRIAETLRSRGWVGKRAQNPFETEARDVTITGDLWTLLGDTSLAKERVRIGVVGRRGAAALTPLEPDPESPVLLLGDSHNLVFHAGGDLHARGAGLPDHLARELGFAVDVVAVRGSGATPARMNLLRRKNALTQKRVVVWCLAARELSESAGGWRPLPVAR